MIMSMFKMIAVSNWELYQKSHKGRKTEDYVEHLCNLEQRQYRPDMLILREKNLSEEEYGRLFAMTWERLKDSSIELLAHTYLSAVQQTGADKIHLPFPLLEQYTREKKLSHIKFIGASVHSAEEAAAAQKLGASYITAGHIFATECKPGITPRGIGFLEKVCENVTIPVYAIGGIHPENLEKIRRRGAQGACMMSEYMK